jgi:hypothetical protein
MSTSLVVAVGGELELDVVPEVYKERFVDMVLECYASSARLLNGALMSGNYEIPDIVDDIDATTADFFLIAALAQEDDDPSAFDQRMLMVDTIEEHQSLLDDLYDEFLGDDDLRRRYIDDIAAVCNFYQLSHVITFYASSLSYERYYELHNYPIVEVW